MFMANQYITVENQTLLWKTIQRSPQFVNNTISINKEQWFSSIIKQFYEKMGSSKMTVAELKALNQQTITYMVGDLKRIESMYITPPISAPSPQSTPMNFETPQSRMSMYNDQFNARQQEYANMGKPPAPPIANFSEKVEDDAITNMDELLQQQMKQREYDVAMVRPPPPPGLTVTEQVPSSPISSPMSNASESRSSQNVGSPHIFRSNANENAIAQNSVGPDVMVAIQELTKQLAELRDEVRVLRENTAVKPIDKSPDLELPGVEP
jgi:hypothetical protein